MYNQSTSTNSAQNGGEIMPFGSKLKEYISSIDNGVTLTDDEKTLLDTYRGFNDEGKEKLLDTASDMAQLDRYKKCAKSDVVEKEA